MMERSLLRCTHGDGDVRHERLLVYDMARFDPTSGANGAAILHATSQGHMTVGLPLYRF